jgi:predicted nucleic acid-binding protein
VTDLVLIDTSVWVAVLRRQAQSEIASRVEEVLKKDLAAMAWPVWLELRQGTRGAADLARLESLKTLCHWLPFDDACWQLATEAACRCRQCGTPVPTGDLLVFAVAQHHSAELLAVDQHFDAIRKALT